MGGFASISAAGKSIERLLAASFADQNPVGTIDAPGAATTAKLVRTEDFEKVGGNFPNLPVQGVSIFLYRIEVNKVMRASWSALSSVDGRAHLPVDLHYLVTPWAANAEFEQRILGKTLESLESRPILSGPLLSSDGDWTANEGVQLCLEDLTFESIMRVFDSLPIDFKPSLPYLARVVRIDGSVVTKTPIVTTAVRGLRPTTDEGGR